MPSTPAGSLNAGTGRHQQAPLHQLLTSLYPDEGGGLHIQNLYTSARMSSSSITRQSLWLIRCLPGGAGLKPPCSQGIYVIA